MADFDARWRRVANAAHRACYAVHAPSERRVAELARLAVAHADRRGARENRSRERRLLVAAAIAIVIAWIVWAPDAATWRRFTRGSTALVAKLPDRVPRAPRSWSARSAVRALPDFGAWFRSLADAEVSR